MFTSFTKWPCKSMRTIGYNTSVPNRKTKPHHQAYHLLLQTIKMQLQLISQRGPLRIIDIVIFFSFAKILILITNFICICIIYLCNLIFFVFWVNKKKHELYQCLIWQRMISFVLLFKTSSFWKMTFIKIIVIKNKFKKIEINKWKIRRIK